MKKRLLFLLVFACIGLNELHSQTEYTCELKSFREAPNNDLSDRFIESTIGRPWPMDPDGNVKCAWIRVGYENIALEDFKKVQFSTLPNSPIQHRQFVENSGEKSIWLFITPSENCSLEAIDNFGNRTKRLTIALKEKGVYNLTFKSNDMVPFHVETKPDGCQVVFKDIGGDKRTTPADFQNVPLGRHTIVVYSKNGEKLWEEDVDVTKTKNSWSIDVRKEKTVTFRIKGGKAYLKIDGTNVNMGGTVSEYRTTLKYGTHKVVAYINTSQIDQRTIEVGDASDNIILLTPRNMKDLVIYASYNGSKVSAKLYLNGQEQQYSSDGIYNVTVPADDELKLLVTYEGKTGEKTFKQAGNIKGTTVEVPIKYVKTKSISVWQRYEPEVMGFSLGYVGKQLVTTGEGYQYKEPGVWGEDDEGKWLSGVQVGFHFEPCFKFGLGIYTGLFYEFYYSSYDDSDFAWDNYLEHCGYFPIHGCWRIPFGDECGMFLHAGLGLNYVFSGKYSDSSDYYEDYTDFYGEDTWPKKFNMTLDYGVMLRIGWWMLGANFSSGITDHESYAYLGSYETAQNKMNFTLGFLISNY